MKGTAEEQVPLCEEFAYIYGAATQVLKCGPWKDLWKNESAPKLLFLVIPGKLLNIFLMGHVLSIRTGPSQNLGGTGGKKTKRKTWIEMNE